MIPTNSKEQILEEFLSREISDNDTIREDINLNNLEINMYRNKFSAAIFVKIGENLAWLSGIKDTENELFNKIYSIINRLEMLETITYESVCEIFTEPSIGTLIVNDASK